MTPSPPRLPAFFILALAAWALSGCASSSAGAEAPTPRDTDPDADTDADTDADSDIDAAPPRLEVSNYSGVDIVSASAVDPSGQTSDPLGGASLPDKETVTWTLTAGAWSFQARDADDACAVLESVTLASEKVYYWKIDDLPADCSAPPQ
jgi:hypothetical protein